MELDGVEPAALGVEGLEPRRVLVGEPAALEGLGAAADLAEGGQPLGGLAAALALTASISARSVVNRFTSSNGGLWLMTSWVANVLGHGRPRVLAIRASARQPSNTRGSRRTPDAPSQARLRARQSRRIGPTLMTISIAQARPSRAATCSPARSLSAGEINALLDLADKAAESNRQINKKRDVLRGRTLINLFFEASTRTQSSFELAGKRLGADVMNMNVSTSSVPKGETLIDTAMTLNAMRPDILVVRHHAAGAVELLAQKVDCSVINAGDGAHQHPTQALLDALTIRRAKGRIAGLTVAICGDILHSRVARSNINVLNTHGRARARRRALHAAAARRPSGSARRSSPT